MALDFSKLKKAIKDINEKLPGKFNPVDSNKSELASSFLTFVAGISDEDERLLEEETILYYNLLSENPDEAVDVSEDTSKKPALEKGVAKKAVKVAKPRRCRVHFTGPSVSTTTYATMLICDNPTFSCEQIRNLLLAQGRSISKNTIDTMYAEDRKVLAYLAFKGLIKISGDEDDK
jgi:hypothetical protein